MITVYEKWGFHKDVIAELKVDSLSALNLAIIQYKKAYQGYNVYYLIDEKGKAQIILDEE